MKTWGKMSDEEQGALLLAHHRGEAIQFKNNTDTPYWKDAEPRWAHWCYYRVKKEPVVEVREETLAHKGWITLNATCTYTDGKLTKIHWEAE